MLTGGCLCGALRYEAHGEPFHESICHCTMCRRAAGAPLVAWFTVPRGGLRFTAGTPKYYQSSASARRGFCADCGTQISFEHDDLPAETDVTTASLDEPDRLPPRDHIHTGTRIGWLRMADGLPEHRDSRTGEDA